MPTTYQYELNGHPIYSGRFVCPTCGKDEGFWSGGTELSDRDCDKCLHAKVALVDALESLQHAEIYIDKARGVTEDGVPYMPVAIHLMQWSDGGEEVAVKLVGGQTLAEAIKAATQGAPEEGAGR